MMLLRLAAMIVLFSTFNVAYSELNVGELRTVRLVCTIPYGQEVNQDVVNKMKVDIIRAQQFFAEQLQNYGYGYRSFNIERDVDGTPLVHIIKLEEDEDYKFKMERTFDTDKNIYLLLHDNGEWSFDGLPGYATTGQSVGGVAVIPTYYHIQLVYHELGHTFKLGHSYTRAEFHDPADVMGHIGDWPALKITKCYARSLAIHPYFNEDTPPDIFEFQPPWRGPEEIEGINISIPETYTIDDESIDITINVKNPNGVYQVLLSTKDIFVGCEHGDGSIETTFKIKYEGYRKGAGFFKLNESELWYLYFIIIDMKSNYYALSRLITRKPLEDVNQDDTINILDLVMVANHISGGTFDAAVDVNQDGIINVLDLVSVSQAF